MSPPTLPLFAQTSVLPEPVKVNVVCARLTVGLTTYVGMQVSTPIGVQFYFFDPESAAEVARALSRAVGGIVSASSV